VTGPSWITIRSGTLRDIGDELLGTIRVLGCRHGADRPSQDVWFVLRLNLVSARSELPLVLRQPKSGVGLDVLRENPSDLGCHLLPQPRVRGPKLISEVWKKFRA
jgi:hypothetical protein